MSNLIIDTPAFNCSRILPGHLAIISDRVGNIVATGVILSVWALGIKLAVYDSDDAYYNEDGLNNVKPFHVKIEEITTGDISILIIDPNTYEA